MKKEKKIINKKIIITVLITMIISITIGVKAATMFSSNDVIYDNSSSGTTASTVKEALDELYEKANNCGSTSSICTSTSGTVSYALGTKYICNVGDGTIRTFYVLEDNGDGVDLIMDENIGDDVEWYDSMSNEYGPITALAYLEEQTSNWTIEATLPTGEQIADAVGSTSWTPKDGHVSLYRYTWLYESLSLWESTGYWTSTPEPNTSFNAWAVKLDDDYIGGSLEDTNCFVSYGVRPVITIPKDQLS